MQKILHNPLQIMLPRTNSASLVISGGWPERGTVPPLSRSTPHSEGSLGALLAPGPALAGGRWPLRLPALLPHLSRGPVTPVPKVRGSGGEQKEVAPLYLRKPLAKNSRNLSLLLGEVFNGAQPYLRKPLAKDSRNLSLLLSKVLNGAQPERPLRGRSVWCRGRLVRS